MLFGNIINSSKDVSDTIEYDDLCIKYYNSFFPIKNEKQEKNNLIVQNDLEVLLCDFCKKEPLLSKM